MRGKNSDVQRFNGGVYKQIERQTDIIWENKFEKNWENYLT